MPWVSPFDLGVFGYIQGLGDCREFSEELGLYLKGVSSDNVLVPSGRRDRKGGPQLYIPQCARLDYFELHNFFLSYFAFTPPYDRCRSYHMPHSLYNSPISSEPGALHIFSRKDKGPACCHVCLNVCVYVVFLFHAIPKNIGA